jgi:prepilin-type N-terminal cleavage/methylation domain-containing protein
MLNLYPSRFPPPASRSGFTLAELVVGLAVGGVVFGAFALAVARQERVHSVLAARVRARAQVREGAAALVTDLRGISPAAGDIAAGTARDSAIELRTTIGSTVVCEVTAQSVVGALSSFVTPPTASDTAWAYLASDTAASWVPLALAGAGTLPADQLSTCAFPPTASSVIGHRGATRRSYALALSEPPPQIPIGTPIRVTRPARYSLYRSADSSWYLGRREWSSARGRFETIQPVSGPYPSYAPEGSGTSGLELRYFDSSGEPVPSGSLTTHGIARVTIVTRLPPSAADRRVLDRRDVTSATVAFRNSP